jgi:hypothetical protein
MERRGISVEFLQFTEDSWVLWLQGFFRKEAITPQLPVYEDRYAEELIALFRELRDVSVSSRFCHALTRVFEATPPEAAFVEPIYYSLHVLAVATSPRSHAALRQRLEEETLLGLTFAGTQLHSLLLSVNGVYPVDEWLAHYIRRSTRARLRSLTERQDRGASFSVQREDLRNYVLLGWRLLAKKDVQECSEFLGFVQQASPDPIDTGKFGLQLLAATLEHGWRFLLQLYLAVAEKEDSDEGTILSLLTAAISKYVFPSFGGGSGEEEDQFAMLLDFLLKLDSGFLSADGLVGILRMIDAMSSADDQQLAIRALQLGYRVSGEAWDYTIKSVDHLPIREDKNTAAVMVYGDNPTTRKLHRERDEGVLTILAKSMPRPGASFDPMLAVRTF